LLKSNKLLFLVLSCGLVLFCQNSGRVYERDVREGLGKIAELPFSDGIVFFGKKPKIISQCEQSLE
jgi:hypothetical protein